MSFYNFFRKNYGAFLVLLFAFLVVNHFYGNLLRQPNNYLFSGSGDGLKNYYTYNYYLHHNQSKWNFEGYNYPYGESFFYTDGHPIEVFFIKAVSTVFPGIKLYSIGIINFFMIFSLVISSFLSYLVLQRLQVIPWFAVLASVSIMVLSPQITRYPGHLALSYAFAIPLTIYLLIVFEHTNKSFLLILQCLNIFFWFATHAYLGMVATLLILAYYFVKFLHNPKAVYKNIRFYGAVFVQSILPFLLFTLSIALTDSHDGRTNNPYGFLAYKANFVDVFLPNQGPLTEIYRQIHWHPKQYWGSGSYIGIVSVIVLLVYVLKSLFLVFKNRGISINDQQPRVLRYLFWAAILVLLFSFAIPFRFNLEILLEWFSPVKQFRAVGRFTWVFYYVVMYFVAFQLYTYYLNAKLKKLAIVILICLPLITIAEGYKRHIEMSRQLTKTPNYFLHENLAEEIKKGIEKVNTDEYQAIISVPFFFIGGDNYTVNAPDKAYFYSNLFSFHTGLPLLGSHLTRNSLWEAKNVCAVFTPDWIKKEIKSDIKSPKPFLIIQSKGNLKKVESDIILKSTQVFEGADFSLFRLAYDSLFNYNPQKYITGFLNDSAKLFQIAGWMVSDTSKYFNYCNFDSLQSILSYHGKGAFYGLKSDLNTLIETSLHKFDTSQTYQLSFWFYNCGPNYGQDRSNFNVFVYQRDSLSHLTSLRSLRALESTHIQSCWTKVETSFKISNPSGTLLVQVQGPKFPAQSIIIDDLLIFSTQLELYKIFEYQADSQIIELSMNNNFIKVE